VKDEPPSAEAEEPRLTYRDLLLKTRVEGYRDMTVAEFRDAFQENFAKEYEGVYLDWINGAPKDRELIFAADTDEDAAYLLKTLIPLVGDQWREQVGWKTSVHADGFSSWKPVEYSGVRTILDADKLTVGQYEDVYTGVLRDMEALVSGAAHAQGYDEAAIREGAAKCAARYSNEAVSVTLAVTVPEFDPAWDTQRAGTASDAPPDEESASRATKEDYQLLLDTFQVEGYRSMSVNEFEAIVKEGFSVLNSPVSKALDRVLGDTSPERPVSNAEVKFLYSTLIYTMDTYVARDQAQYGGPGYPVYRCSTEAGNVSTGFEIYYQVLDGDQLSVEMRDGLLHAVVSKVLDCVENGEATDQQALEDKIKNWCESYSSKRIWFDGKVNFFENRGEQ
jgi:hypothetical protein